MTVEIRVKSATEFFELEEAWDKHANTVPAFKPAVEFTLTSTPRHGPVKGSQPDETMAKGQFEDVDMSPTTSAQQPMCSVESKSNGDTGFGLNDSEQRELTLKLRKWRRRVASSLNKPIYEQFNVEQFSDAFPHF